jgi:hypothetical protein
MPPNKRKVTPGFRSGNSAQDQNNKRPAVPSWLAFHPLISASDLALHEILPEQIVTISNFWTSTLSKNYVSFLSSLPLTKTLGKPKKGDALRVNDRFQSTFLRRSCPKQLAPYQALARRSGTEITLHRITLTLPQSLLVIYSYTPP